MRKIHKKIENIFLRPLFSALGKKFDTGRKFFHSAQEEVLEFVAAEKKFFGADFIWQFEAICANCAKSPPHQNFPEEGIFDNVT